MSHKAIKSKGQNPLGPDRAKLLKLLALPPCAQIDLIEEILPFIGLGAPPDTLKCIDMLNTTYVRINSLAEILDLASSGIEEGNIPRSNNNPFPWFAEAIRFQVQLGHLASNLLHTLYLRDAEARDQSRQPA
jgi:hypothetical protein